jgi:hypothetical protein
MVRQFPLAPLTFEKNRSPGATQLQPSLDFPESHDALSRFSAHSISKVIPLGETLLSSFEALTKFRA